MRMLWPNLEQKKGLETVLEVPIPEEMFAGYKQNTWENMKSWVKQHTQDKSSGPLFGDRTTEVQLLLGVIGAPLIPLPISTEHSFDKSVNDYPLETAMAKYIVQQYIAASGGDHVLNAIDSMYAMGKVKMAVTEMITGEGLSSGNQKDDAASLCNVMKIKSNKNVAGEVGSFVLWQQRPDLWTVELVVSGCKISAGSDGEVAWRQTPWHSPHASRGPPRPLRRCLQGLDPRATANMFSNAICIGERKVEGEGCYVLKLETEPATLKARSSNNVDMMRHTIWGCFSQKTGLLVQLEDSHLLRIKAPGSQVFWETQMVSTLHDYEIFEGVNIAHSGKTLVSLFRHGETSEGHSRTRMEEAWTIEEVSFNVKGMSKEFFMPPSELKKEGGLMEDVPGHDHAENAKARRKKWANAARVLAINEEEAITVEENGKSST